MRDLPISLLRTFITVAETLNLSAAATRLHRAPSTISMQLSRLEELVSADLVERGQYGVRMTPAGEQLKQHARQLLNLHDQIVGSFQNCDLDGPVRLGTHDQYASRTLAPLLENYMLSYPEARLEVTCDHRPFYLASLVNDRKLDLALVEMPASAPGGIRLNDDELVWVGSASHNAHQRKVLPLAVFVEGCFHRDSAIEALEAAGVNYRIAFTSQSRAGILAAVRAGICIAIIPRSTVEPDLQIINDRLPGLPKTRTTLLQASDSNSASRRLSEIIRQSQLFDCR
ncbi:LysR family transcriptional regulator [Marinobacterium jannaschii]|uniref:LysR family transcriptional regulator n=1 Tax=Marinobacterium jannaschii TaxID=64970 RepID=UPI00047F554F|nr:LysR family transcriptional regulator [Marinobacterium jannaschii]